MMKTVTCLRPTGIPTHQDPGFCLLQMRALIPLVHLKRLNRPIQTSVISQRPITGASMSPMIATGPMQPTSSLRMDQIQR